MEPSIPQINLVFGWAWFVVGALSGSVVGLRFREEGWLGGYGSWSRRMVRLGHVAFFGTGLLNVVFALTIAARPEDVDVGVAVTASSVALLVGGVTMPLVCFLAGYRKGFAQWFFVPVVSLIVGLGLVVLSLLRDGWQGG